MSQVSDIELLSGSGRDDAENGSLSSTVSDDDSDDDSDGDGDCDDDGESFVIDEETKQSISQANQLRCKLVKLRTKYVDDEYNAVNKDEDEDEENENEDGDDVVSSKHLIWVLEELCGSDALSVESLQKIIEEDIIKTEDLRFSHFFHRACYNKNIDIDIVAKLLHLYPEAASIDTDFYSHQLNPDETTKSYPLHLACLNDHCHPAIILELLKRNPNAIGHMCKIGRKIQTGNYDRFHVGGLPLHYYLSRICNVDVEMVEILMKLDSGNPLRSANDDAPFAPIHVLCCNPGINDMLDVIRSLIEADPESLQFQGGDYLVPFLVACENKNVTLPLIRLLLDNWPGAIQQHGPSGTNALHLLSSNTELDEENSAEIFHFFMEKNFSLLRETNLEECLPIHLAVVYKSPEFCRLLIGAYPESLKIRSGGSLPFHEACCEGIRLDTVVFLHEQYPECIGLRDEDGFLPIHRAAQNQGNEASAIIKYLILQDPGAASAMGEFRQWYPLHIACDTPRADMDTVKVLFNSYPEAIYKRGPGGRLPVEAVRNITHAAAETAVFLAEQLAHVRRAKYEPSARLPLHRALHEHVSLGTIKLIVRGFPASIYYANCEGVIPLHIACEHASVDIVKYLVDIDGCFLDVCDIGRNYPLHYACRGANNEVIKYLLGRNAPSISERNTANLLPFQLLCTCGVVKGNSECPKYMESLWCVLTAYPDAIS